MTQKLSFNLQSVIVNETGLSEWQILDKHFTGHFTEASILIL